MVGLYKDPKGEKIFSTTHTAAGKSGEDKHLMVISALQGRIKELECELAERKVMCDLRNDPNIFMVKIWD